MTEGNSQHPPRRVHHGEGGSLGPKAVKAGLAVATVALIVAVGRAVSPGSSDRRDEEGGAGTRDALKLFGGDTLRLWVAAVGENKGTTPVSIYKNSRISQPSYPGAIPVGDALNYTPTNEVQSFGQILNTILVRFIVNPDLPTGVTGVQAFTTPDLPTGNTEVVRVLPSDGRVYYGLLVAMAPNSYSGSTVLGEVDEPGRNGNQEYVLGVLVLDPLNPAANPPDSFTQVGYVDAGNVVFLDKSPHQTPVPPTK